MRRFPPHVLHPQFNLAFTRKTVAKNRTQQDF
jgi:hypothetical protein